MPSEPENFDNAETAPEIPAVDEQLIAYLDGELDDETTRQVEQQLSSDPETRRSLGRLERTWNLLDGLERSDVDEVFTHSTLEMVATVAADEVQEKRDEAPRKLRRLRWIGSTVLLVAAVTGFLSVRILWSDPTKELLRNLHVLEDLDEYREIQDVEFLQALHETGLFPVEVDVPAVDPPESGPDSLDARRWLVEQMSAKDKMQLLKRQTQFGALPDDQRRRVTELHQKITDDRQTEQLHHAMHGYYEWLKTLTPSQRSEVRDLRELPTTERVAEIDEMRREQERRRLDAEGFRRWFDAYAEREADRLHELRAKQAPDAGRRRPGSVSDPAQANRIFLLIHLQRWQSGRPDTLDLRSEDLTDLRESLSPETQGRLASMQETDQLREIRKAVALGSQRMLKDSLIVTDEELAEFLQSDELPDQWREMLLNLPVAEMRYRLTGMYLMGGRAMEGFFGAGPGGPGWGRGAGGGPGGGRPPGAGSPRSGGRLGGPGNGRGPME